MKVVSLFLLVGLLAGYGLPKLAVKQVCPQREPTVVAMTAEPAAEPHDTPTVDEVRHFITQVALEMSVPPQLALEIAKSESGFRPHAVRLERNRTLSMGVFQINQQMVRPLGIEDPLDYKQNVIGAIGHMKHLIDRYGADGVKCRWVNGEWSKSCR
jgi:soluble lytic murein transglycosylase-like protein